jgi:flagellar biosynthesis/type III secretory pathway protein FliH
MMMLDIRKLVGAAAIAAFMMLCVGVQAQAQNVNKQYNQWQRAQQEAQRRQMDYQRTHRASDYRQWQNAQAKAQREYNDYIRASGRNNNGYYNNGYNTGVVYNGNNGRMYRIYRNGSYYSTDYRGAELLRQAVNNGYRQGYNQGVNDRRYRRSYNFRDDGLYRSGTFGYQSYVARDQYQYYFQQGYQRGYEDGYRSTRRYGYQSGNAYNILGSVLNTILNIAQQ